MLALLQPGFQAETLTLAANLMPAPTYARDYYMNEVIAGLKAAGIWSKYKACFDLCTNATGMRGRDWVTPGRTLPTQINTGGTTTGTVTATSDRYVAGDGATGLNFGVAASALGLTTGSYRVAAWSSEINAVAAGHNGARQSTVRTTVGVQGSVLAGYCNTLIASGSVSGTVDGNLQNGGFGMVAVQQIDASNCEIYCQGVKFAGPIARAAQTIPTVNVYCCGYNNLNALAEPHSNRISFLIFSDQLTAAQHVTEQAIWNRYMKRIGNWKAPSLADGDSLMANRLDYTVPRQFGLITYPNRQWINTAVSGETSGQIKARIMAKDVSQSRDWLLLFNMGRNNISSSSSYSDAATKVATVMSDMRDVVTWWTNNTEGRYLVFGTQNGDSMDTVGGGPGDMRDYGPAAVAPSGGNVYYARTLLDLQMQDAFGNHAVPVQAALLAANDGTAGDLADVANGIVPRSLRYDYLHNDADGTLVYAQQAEIKRILLGYE